MVVSLACVNIFCALDRWCPFLLPFKFIYSKHNTNSIKVMSNPCFTSNRPFGKIFWLTVQGLRFFVILLSFFQIITVITDWNSNDDFVTLCYYCLQFAAILSNWFCCQALYKFANDICYLTTQRFLLVKIVHSKTDIHSVLVYGFTFAFSGCPVFFGAMPFLGKSFENKTFLHKAVVSVTTALVSTHGTLLFFTPFLLSIIYFESFSFLFDSACKTDMHDDQIAKMCLTKGSCEFFRKALRKYRCIQYMVQCLDIIIRRVCLEILAVGTIVVSWCGYVTVTMYNEFPVFLYISCASVCIAGFLTNTVFITLGARIYNQSVQFKIYWKQKGRTAGKIDSRKLKACPELNLNIGGIENVRKDTSLLIADVFLNCIATLVLMKT